MKSQKLIKMVGYCGLACKKCKNACQPGCRGGSGPEDCYQRNCCNNRALQGCWECIDFPCNNGFFEDGNDPAFRGICIGSVQCIKEFGIEKYLRIVSTKLGKVIEYGDYRYLNPEDVKKMLNAE
jgi:hypothetical protein